MTPEQLQEKYKKSVIREDKESLCRAVAAKIMANFDRYEAVSTSRGIPWWVVGIIHSLESGCNFGTHLHNGDPLSARTTHVPKGRPLHGQPPFTWEYSASDALKHDSIDSSTIGTILDSLEKYNGLGYRKGAGRATTPPKTSPYIWSMTDQYEKGKYVADNEFDRNAVSQQVGAAAIMKALEQKGVHLLFGAVDRKYTAEDVGWFEVHLLENDGMLEIGVVAKIGGTDKNFATARFSCDTTLQAAFFRQFHNARNRVLAAPGKPWPNEVAQGDGEVKYPVWQGRKTFPRGADIRLSANFYLSEFECHCGCSTTVVDYEHLQTLQRFRTTMDAAIRITSGYRCPDHNRAVGGATNSQHLYGNACDITMDGWTPRNVFIASDEFFNGRGEYATFTHVDSRAEKATWKG